MSFDFASNIQYYLVIYGSTAFFSPSFPKKDCSQIGFSLFLPIFVINLGKVSGDDAFFTLHW